MTRIPTPTLFRTFSALLALGALAGCYETQPPPDPPLDGCPRDYVPVCGDDGVTYANACSAEAAGATVVRTGPCDGDGPCDADTDCAVGAVCNVPPDCRDSTCAPGAPCLPPLPCSERKVCEPCACPENYDPVCGLDGVTYGNGCEARCAHVGVLPRPGACGAPTCPSPAPPDACNAMCGPAGGTYTTGEDGCLYCTCNPPTSLCDDVMCALACEFGFVIGADGCPLCECAAPPDCPAIDCEGTCTYGFVRDARGCETCECNPSPPAPPAMRLCLDASACAPMGEYCDTTMCYSPCDPGMTCPDVCYGVCTALPEGGAPSPG